MPEMNAKRLGTTLAQLRKRANMTQAELAQKLNVSSKTVSKWEIGQGFPKLHNSPRYLHFLVYPSTF